jgi:penicillin amidase
MNQALAALFGALVLAVVFSVAPALAEEAAPAAVTEHGVSGLQAPAEIIVDRWGVPHIYAENIDDLFFAQGFNAARDRLWQLDLWRRRGEGLLAEAFGPSFVKKDRAARLFLFRGDMHAEWLAYASDTKRIVTAFVAGINAYIQLTRERSELLPPEFKLLNYEPGLWTPETVVRIRSHGLVRNAARELSRALFVREYGLNPLKLRDRPEPSHQTQVPEGLDLSLLSEDVLHVYRLATRGVSFSENLRDQLSGVSSEAVQLFAGDAQEPFLFSQDGAGSNNWAVASSKSATGRPILANDPHRTLSVPSLRYIAHLSAPGLNVIGAGEPALPGISIGHNDRIAFGLTIFAIDQEDLYVYRTNPDAADEYWYRGRWEPMRVLNDSIPVRGSEPRQVTYKFTRHGPVVYEDPSRQVAVAVRAAWLEPGMAPYLGSIEYMRAENWDDFLAAMNRWGAPSENQVYADVDGNIGWKPGGLAPIRPNWDGLLPVPGDGRYEWAGFRDMDELPLEHNRRRQIR